MRISDWSSDVCSSDLLSTREKGSNQAFRHLFKHVLRQMGRGGDPLKLGAHQPAIGMVESPPAAKRRDEARGRLRIDPVPAQDHVREDAVTLSYRGMEPPLIGGQPAPPQRARDR